MLLLQFAVALESRCSIHSSLHKQRFHESRYHWFLTNLVIMIFWKMQHSYFSIKNYDIVNSLTTSSHWCYFCISILFTILFLVILCEKKSLWIFILLCDNRVFVASYFSFAILFFGFISSRKYSYNSYIFTVVRSNSNVYISQSVKNLFFNKFMLLMQITYFWSKKWSNKVVESNVKTSVLNDYSV